MNRPGETSTVVPPPHSLLRNGGSTPAMVIPLRCPRVPEAHSPSPLRPHLSNPGDSLRALRLDEGFRCRLSGEGGLGARPLVGGDRDLLRRLAGFVGRIDFGGRVHEWISGWRWSGCRLAAMRSRCHVTAPMNNRKERNGTRIQRRGHPPTVWRLALWVMTVERSRRTTAVLRRQFPPRRPPRHGVIEEEWPFGIGKRTWPRSWAPTG